MKGKCRSLILAGVLALFFGPVGLALGYSTVVSFGDSLSDNGNVGRFTDGPIWVEQLADHYEVPLDDIAYGGATTGYDNPANDNSPITGLKWQVEQFNTLPTGSLVTVWAGANDLLQLRSPFDAVANIDDALENLYLSGGRSFLVPNLPDIGKVPKIFDNPIASTAATLWTGAYNGSLDPMLDGFENRHQDVQLYFIDTFTIFNQFPVDTKQWRDLFWLDGFHPSSLGHQLIYDAAVAVTDPVTESATDPVPEPATVVLFGAGLVGLAGLMIRRKKKVSAKP